MAKIVVHHEEDPGIGVLLEYVAPETPGRAQGWYGTCTTCPRTIHRWNQSLAIEAARRHVDNHPAVLIGGDTDALIS